MTTNLFVVYTDGAHKNQWGSWAFVVLRNNKVVGEGSGRLKNTDSLRMEIQAVLEAITYLGQNQNLEIHTDCRILIENVTKFETWKQQGWKKKNQAPIPNVDLYQQLYVAIQTQQIHWKWVRAHSQNPFNERCDQLCREARSSALLVCKEHLGK